MNSGEASLFEVDDASRPLADRLRPRTLAEVVGQDHLLGPDAPLGRMVARGALVSSILWGPPGCGKTTIARLLADATGLAFEPLSATFAGVADLRKVFTNAQKRREVGQGTLLFVDEVHRFNRAQQDSFLPYVEDGTIILIGATTENPSFELNGALLSRCQVFVLKRLDEDALLTLIDRAETLTGHTLPLDADARQALVALADGDGRYLLNLAEQLLALPVGTQLDTAGLAKVVQKRAPLYDKTQESHYNLISALHKAMRGSDPDAALYWLARMLDGGEDPLYIARRLVRFANEDIAMADPQAIHQALAAWDVYERLGSPEGELAIAQAVVYLATAPKSIAVYRGLNRAMREAKNTGSLMPPAHILNAPTRLMKQLGYGKGYEYDPDTQTGFSGANYFPDGVERTEFYEPTSNGYERAISERLAHWQTLRTQRARHYDQARGTTPAPRGGDGDAK
ncbi:replication-associated recombination protein A [Propionimicrobium sp. PCR01-08-3]|uniref:replication-associated recombination protein A n=1 Tax=Propionimicrobium sp. PCR01-08-3 TaxID=3052086 RepID=UPI00255C9C80|nr:replication-associated recombination protein A [Propionimicrobium sp. PCR01-08-3]WIY83552.1 replication-associated recombination protein A [Propionimicrobium sp. PCR01-08-3]